ncbi:unnamed protein product, partial [Phaeothamnion confervicola]
MRRWKATSIALLVALAVLAPHVRHADAASRQQLVGHWYSETPGHGEHEGKKFTVRRLLAVNNSNGTKINTFRFYDDARLVGELVTTFTWGFDKNVFWTVCQNTVSNGAMSACTGRNEYDVLSIGATEFRYVSRSSKTKY